MRYEIGDKLKITFDDDNKTTETAEVIHVLGEEVTILVDTDRYVIQRLVQGKDETKDVFGFSAKVTKLVTSRKTDILTEKIDVTNRSISDHVRSAVYDGEHRLALRDYMPLGSRLKISIEVVEE